MIRGIRYDQMMDSPADTKKSTSLPRMIMIVPCYNEAARLQQNKFLDFRMENCDLRFLFVNDGSSDETQSVLDAMSARSPNRMTSLRLLHNVGKAEAVRQGMLHGLKDNPDLIGFLDADLATSLEELPRFFEVMEVNPAIKLVMGSRIRLLGRNIERNAARHYIGRVFATFASMALRMSVYDTQCGAKLFRRTPEIASLFAQKFLSRWVFDVEILARLAASNCELGFAAEFGITELPLMEWRDVHGSKVKAIDGIRAYADIVRIGWRYRRNRKSARSQSEVSTKQIHSAS